MKHASERGFMTPIRFASVGHFLLLALAALIAVSPSALGQVNVQGQWTTLSNVMPINPIHAALLRNGKVLVVAGSGNCPPSQSGCPSGAPYGLSNHSGAGVYDPVAKTFTQFTLSWDMFCNSAVVLPDGRVFINGGTTQYDPFHGALTSAVFDPATNTFTNLQNMAHGRWYPTVTTLGDGRLMTFSGSDENGNTNTAVEIYTVGTGWSTQFPAGWTPPLYPRMHLLPNGNVFYSGPSTISRIFNPSTTTWTNSATTKYGGTRTYGSSVLLPLTPANNYDPKVMIMGGNSPATSTTEIIDLGAATPSWVTAVAMSQPRIEMNAVILPNGKVLALGGSTNDEDTSTLSLNADLFDLSAFNPSANPPNLGSRASAGTNASERLYHSVALLLPDATVWLAGGNPSRGTYNNTMEIYQPPYLFTSGGSLAARPTITTAPAFISYGSQFLVQSPDAASISGGAVVLVRPGAVTHAFNMDQRLVGMSYTVGSGLLTVTAPPNGNIAPPGYYMLFILNSSGVPSVASFVQLGQQQGDFSITAAPSSQTVSAGSGTSYTVSITGSGGFNGTVGLSVTGLPVGATATFNPSLVTNAGSSTLTVNTSSSTAGGSYPLTVTGSSGSLTHNTPVTLVVGSSAAATPGFSPLPGTFTASVNVTLSDTTPGAVVHCTTDGSPATPSSPTCTVVNVTTTTTINAIAVASGYNNSAPASGMYTIISGTTPINYGSGFTGTGLQLNGKATVSGTRLRLTDGGANEASSAFFSTGVNVQSFSTSFSFQLTSASADGMAFVIQNNGVTALGPGGGGLGYGPSTAGATAYAGMSKGVAVKFDLYSNSGEGINSTGLYTGGASPTTPAIDMTSSGVDLHSGDVFNVQMSYDGTTLTMTITDASNPAQSFTTSWTVNIPTAVGSSNTAFVGFTGGTGGLTAIQEVLNWTYNVTSGSNPPAAPTNVTANAGNAQVTLSWSASTGASSYNVKRSTTSGGPYTTIASPTTTGYTDSGVSNGTTYYYVVTAVNGSGESGNSSQVGATPQAGVPAAPTNVTANAGNAQVTLSWSASTGASSYKVKRSTTSGGPYTTIASPTTTGYTDSGVSNGTTYYYVVTAVNTGGGESANSSQVSATPSSGVSGSVVVDSSSVGAGALRASSLSWSHTVGSGSNRVLVVGVVGACVPSVTYGGVALTHAGQVYNNNQAPASTDLFVLVNPATGTNTVRVSYSGCTSDVEGGSISFTGVDQSTPLAHVTTNFGSGTAAQVAVASVAGDMVVDVVGNGSAIASSRQTLSWLKNQNGNTAVGNGAQSTAAGASSVTMGYSVSSDWWGIIGADVVAAATSSNPPAAPTNVTANAGNAQVTLSWSASTGASSYNVKRSTTSGGPYTTIASPTTTGYTDSGVSNGTTYYYVVTAVNGSGESGNSSQVGATPQAGVPAAPTNVTANAGNAQVTLSWSASTGASSYKVKRSTTSGGPYTTIASPTTTGYTDSGVSNGTTYYYVVTAVNTGGGESANSSQVSATPTSGTTPINYGSGFTGTGLQLNGKAALNGTRLRLTDGGASEASSAFFSTGVNVQSFSTSFSFQLTSASADGMAFVIQNNGVTALGPGGGGLGYGPSTAGATAYAGMSKGVAVKFDLYSNSGEGINSTGLYTGGASPTTPAIDMTSSGVDLHSGDVFNVQMSYDGTTLTMTITDASNPAQSFTTSWTVNIPTAVGSSNTAFVGFTGGTGGLTAIQEVLNWTYNAP